MIFFVHVRLTDKMPKDTIHRYIFDEKAYSKAYNLLLENIKDSNEDWFLYYMTICSYYVGDYRIARICIDKSMLMGNQYSEYCHRNYKWYLQTLPSTRHNFKKETLTKLAFEEDPNVPVQVSYFPANPTIVKTDNGYLANIRYVNYLVRHGGYPSTSEGDAIKTKNILVELDKNLDELRSKELDDSSRPKKTNIIQGIEDIRLEPGSTFEHANIIGTVCDDPNVHCPKMLYGVVENGILIDSFVAIDPSPNRCEKNWVPIEGGSYLYGFSRYNNKTYITMVKPSKYKFEPIIVEQGNYNLDWIRGSSQVIKYNNTYICIVHHVTLEEVDGKTLRRYLHRFIKFNNNMVMTHMTHAFIIENSLIQYIPGLCLDHSGENFIMTMSIHDRTAQMRIVKCSVIDDMLVSLEDIMSVR